MPEVCSAGNDCLYNLVEQGFVVAVVVRYDNVTFFLCCAVRLSSFDS